MLAFSQAQASVTAAGAAAGAVALAAFVALAAGVAAAVYKILVVVAFGTAVPVFDTKQ
jgi:outer membrane receptor protein involved in Fe transport